ncbi:MAG: hypothetical protein VB049_03075 [Candidatus Pelethousia sp.]|nr:hypothetical protein [Candidatus Pelethousia sp.]
MITIFNRREVCITRLAKERIRVRSLLDGLGIENQTVVGTLGSAGRYHGMPGIRWEHAYEYRVYVQKRRLTEPLQR